MRSYLTLLIPVLLGACDDTDFHGAEPGEGLSRQVAGDYCGAQAVFEAHCTACHSTGGAAGGLDLESDAYGALVDVDSAGTPGAILVAPGDPEGSLLFRKARGTQADDEGGTMPPGTEGLSDSELALLWEWIESGATDSCQDDGDTAGAR